MRKIVLIILIVFLTIVPNVSVSKADELTNPVWEKVIANGLYLNQPINNNAQSMALTEDNGIIAISTKRTNSNADIYVVKTERTGEKIWEKRLGTSGDVYGISVITTIENNYVITGLIQTPNVGEVSYVACLNQSGDIIWERQIGMYGSDKITSVQETGDGGYILTGQSKEYPRYGLTYNIRKGEER